MADTADTPVTPATPDKKQDRTAAKLARQIGAFAKQHGGAEGQLAHIGQAGTRIVLVGTDGAGATWWPRPTAWPSWPPRRPG